MKCVKREREREREEDNKCANEHVCSNCKLIFEVCIDL